MPDQKISQLTAGGAAQATDLLPVARGATNVSLLAKDIATALERLAASGQSLTGAQATSLVDLAATWNTTGTPTAIRLNVTDTASNAASLLMDLQVGASSRFRTTKFGLTTLIFDTAQIASGLIVRGTNAIDYWTLGASLTSNSSTVVLTGGATGLVNVGAGMLHLTHSGTTDARINSFNNLIIQPGGVAGGSASSVVEQRNGTNAQTFRLYNTFTDASNYERGKLEWASNVLRIGTEKAGTGTARALEFQTDGTTRVTVGATDGLVTAGGYVLNDPTYGVRRTSNANATSITGGSTGGASVDIAATFVGLNAVVERNWTNAQIRFDDITSTTIAAVALRNGTQPQRLHVYSTFASTTSYERLTVAAQTAAAFQIRTNKGSGGGTARALELGTDDTTRVTIPTTGGCVVGTAALATNATDGFLYVPTCAGTPTGTPTAQTGTVPIVVDTTNNKLYFYSGAAWRDAGP